MRQNGPWSVAPLNPEPKCPDGFVAQDRKQNSRTDAGGKLPPACSTASAQEFVIPGAGGGFGRNRDDMGTQGSTLVEAAFAGGTARGFSRLKRCNAHLGRSAGAGRAVGANDEMTSAGN